MTMSTAGSMITTAGCRGLERRSCGWMAAMALAVVPVALGCGSQVAPAGAVSPAGDYRRQQIDRALVGVTVSDGRLVASPALPFDESELLQALADVEDLLARGLRPRAIERAVAAARGAPDDPRPWAALGQALLTTRRTPVARAAFATAVDRDPGSAEARHWLGVAHDRLGQRDDAVDAWLDAVELEPGHGPSHARLASVSWLRGDRSSAARHLEAAGAAGQAVPAWLAEALVTGTGPAATVHRGQSAGRPPAGEDAPEIGAQVRLNPTIGSVRANETTGAAGPPGEVVGAWNDYSAGGAVRTGVAVSLDGASWTDQVVRAPAAQQSDVEGDPMTAVDPRTGTLWVGAISFDVGGGLFVARKQAGSDLFEPSVTTLVSSSADKGWMAAGPRPGLPDTTRLYVAYNLGLQHSDDLGDTWSAPVPLGSSVGFLPRVGPDGTVFISAWNYGSQQLLMRSTDGGQSVSPVGSIVTLMDSWDIYFSPQIPGEFRVPQLASLAVDPTDGSLACVFFDTSGVAGGNADVDLFLTRSFDDGDTWTIPVVISFDPDPPGDQFFPWLEIDAAGRMHVVYLDSSRTVQDDAAVSAWLDAAYAFSDDDGATWTRHWLTDSPFDTALTDLGGGQFIGDYTGMAVAGDVVWPVYLSTQGGAPGIYSHRIESASVIFADDFESGDTSRWTATSP